MFARWKTGDNLDVHVPRASLLLRLALATGFPSSQSLVMRSALGVAGVTLLQRFVLWPTAAVAFDVFIAIAVVAILILWGFFIVRGRGHR